MNKNRDNAKIITITAFLIGYVLIDKLTSNEQNALGNFFMLIGQTLCTSGSDNFRREHTNINNNLSREDLIKSLKYASDVFNNEISKL